MLGLWYPYRGITQGKIDFTDPRKSDEFRLEVDGVHFISNGTIYAFAQPVRYVPQVMSGIACGISLSGQAGCGHSQYTNACTTSQDE